MNGPAQMDLAELAYNDKFGEYPDLSWYEGDPVAFAELLNAAIAKGEPLPDYDEANEIPADAVR